MIYFIFFIYYIMQGIRALAINSNRSIIGIYLSQRS